ncbi:hypothetical protein TsFJ059_004383 [Trichoderma semiorbis]|uniref:Uncharacterized protein n=1 Tax=Trichoderma semiorbis TaxID=1491008 RepID=A0A9P8HXQ8_9HYPO|nr:hypothetical protein TsFJ059_004383 [Trichoderma semiorbis]
MSLSVYAEYAEIPLLSRPGERTGAQLSAEFEYVIVAGHKDGPMPSIPALLSARSGYKLLVFLIHNG